MVSYSQIVAHPRNYFSACHFLPGFGKCERIHGHNYKVSLELDYKKGSKTLDFGVINKYIYEEMQKLNQKILVPLDSSEITLRSVLGDKNWEISVKGKKYSFPKSNVLLLERIKDTTSESLAFYLHNRLSNKLLNYHPNMVKNMSVIIEENIGNKAIFKDSIEK
ncbi:MAG: 6-pyruvoyl trahydropterin synthase family protein [Candidatus Hodarchaeales archaeon]